MVVLLVGMHPVVGPESWAGHPGQGAGQSGGHLDREAAQSVDHPGQAAAAAHPVAGDDHQGPMVAERQVDMHQVAGLDLVDMILVVAPVARREGVADHPARIVVAARHPVDAHLADMSPAADPGPVDMHPVV